MKITDYNAKTWAWKGWRWTGAIRFGYSGGPEGMGESFHSFAFGFFEACWWSFE